MHTEGIIGNKSTSKYCKALRSITGFRRISLSASGGEGVDESNLPQKLGFWVNLYSLWVCFQHRTLSTCLRGPKVRSNTLTLYATRSTCVRGMDGSKIMEKYGKLHTSQTFNFYHLTPCMWPKKDKNLNLVSSYWAKKTGGQILKFSSCHPSFI